MFLAALVTVAQFSFWGNYLPRVYPTRLRGTGESFAANIGGRMIGTFAAYVTTTLSNYTPGEASPRPTGDRCWHSRHVRPTQSVSLSVNWLPEPGEADLPD